MPGRPRLLLLAGNTPTARELLGGGSERYDLVPTSWPPSLDAEGLVVDLTNPEERQRVSGLLQSAGALDALSDGVAVLDLGLRILWANRTFAEWCGRSPEGCNFYEALGSPSILSSDGCAFHNALRGETATKRLRGRDNRIFELHITPHGEGRLLVLCRDVTSDVHQQQQLDALHKAGGELPALDLEALNDLSPEERIELLKQNIHRCTRDLLHYDVIDIRLLDRRTNRLEPLLSHGMLPEIGQLQLRASKEDNGITGYVAVTGRSYLCRDTLTDPRYILGARGMRSSLTVPLIYQDEVVGTFNVESPQVNAFDERDVQFTEIFCREIATALHTLELLSAEKRGTTTHAVEAVRREVALPVDDILSAGAALLERYIGVEAEMAEKIRVILDRARRIKQSIVKVGEDLAPPRQGEEPALPPFKGLRVLVADADERVRRAAHDTLGRWGCVVETAQNGKEALTLARLSTYDALLADIRLPDMTGYDVYRQLRAAQPQARVVLMTEYGYDPSHSLVKARQDGLKHVLFKPFRIDQLQSALTDCGKESA